uniref:Uncharacterized protein n=1 Tax=Rhizophora mucronata TaxID=61149 RepID=A0A2P2P3A6_RHIMU
MNKKELNLLLLGILSIAVCLRSELDQPCFLQHAASISFLHHVQGSCSAQILKNSTLLDGKIALR